MGYFLYSVQSINAEDLKAEIWKKHELDISLRWRIMQVAKKYVHYEDRDEAPFALQIEVAPHNAYQAGQILRNEYASSKKGNYLLGQKLRYIPDHTRLFKHDSKIKLSHAMTRQLHF